MKPDSTNVPGPKMDQMHEDDLHAAHIVVGLMTGVFAIGLLLYAIILLVVSLGAQ